MSPRNGTGAAGAAIEVAVTIPSMLTRATDGRRGVTVRASTLRGALDALLEAHPLLRVHLFDERDELREHVHVFLNDREARWIDDWSVELEPGDTLTILQAVSGG